MLAKHFETADSTWDVEFAADGEQALMMLKAAKLRYDVVWVDEFHSMDDAGLNGHELVEVMRNSFKMKQCVILACTGPAEESKELLNNAGVDYIWPKPAPAPEVIKQTVEQLIMDKLRACGKLKPGPLTDRMELQQ